MGKLSFLKWGVRPFNIALFMAYPTMGAVFAMPDADAATLMRLLVFCLFNVPFIAHVYILNDWSDARLNPEEPNIRAKHALKHPETVSQREVLGLAVVLAAISLAGFFVISTTIFIMGLVLLAVTFFYSYPRFTLKRFPAGAGAAHFTGAAVYFLAGWVLFSPLNTSALAVAIFFGMVIVAGNFYNEIEDFSHDLESGLRTAAVAYGQRPVFRIGLFLFLSSSLLFVILALSGSIPFHLLWPGLALLSFWVFMAVRYRDWKGGDPSKSVRLAGRMAYAIFCLASVAIILAGKF